MTKYQKAKLWRESKIGTREALAARVGYSVEAIYWFERGINPPRGKGRTQDPIADWVWQRYRLACGGLDAELDGRKFNW